MDKITVNKCCCCVELSLGTWGVAIIDLLLSGILWSTIDWMRTIIHIKVINKIEKVDDIRFVLEPEVPKAMAKAYNKYMDKQDELLSEHRYTLYFALYILLVVVLVIHIIATIALLATFVAKKNKLVIPYLVTDIIRFVVAITVFVIYFVKDLMEIDSLIILIILAVLSVYFWIIALSWYKKMGD